MRYLGLPFLLGWILVPAVHALECPRMPEQTRSNWGAEVEAAVGRIGPVKGAELAVRAQSATLNLLEKLPDSDKVYLEQMMFAAYCSALKADLRLSEGDKAALIRTYNSEVRATIRQQASAPRPAPTQPPKQSSGQGGPKAGGNPVKAPAQSTTPPSAVSLQKVMDSLETSMPIEMIVSGMQGSLGQRGDIKWQVTLRMADIFEIVYPYLIASPWEGTIRDRLAQSLADKYLASTMEVSAPANFRIQEKAFQDLSLELRSRGLVSIVNSPTSQGGWALFWRETTLGRDLIDSVRKANRNAEARQQAKQSNALADPRCQADMEAEIQRRVKEATAALKQQHAEKVAEYERRLSSQISTLDMPVLAMERKRFYMEEGQVFTRPDRKLLKVLSVSNGMLEVHSANRSAKLKVTDEWSYYSFAGTATECYLTLVQTEGRRALVEHFCK